MSQTSRIIRPILEFLFPTASPETITFYHGIIRKLAHFTEYAVLGFLAFRGLVGRKYRFFFAALLVLIVAAIDETNQSFNPARTGSPIDVSIDVCGGLIAIVLCYWWIKRRGTRDRNVDL